MENLSALVKQLKEERDRVERQLSGLNAALTAFAGVYSGSTNGKRRIVRAGDKGSHFGRFRPEPVVHPREPPVDGDAVRTLQQFLN